MSKTSITKFMKRQKFQPKEEATLLYIRNQGPLGLKGDSLSSGKTGGLKGRLKEAKNAFFAVLNETPPVPMVLGEEEEAARDPIAYLVSGGHLLALYEGDTYLCKSAQGLTTINGIPKGEKLAMISSSFKDNCFQMKGKELDTQLVHGKTYVIDGTTFKMCSFSIDFWREEITNA